MTAEFAKPQASVGQEMAQIFKPLNRSWAITELCCGLDFVWWPIFSSGKGWPVCFRLPSPDGRLCPIPRRPPIFWLIAQYSS